MPSKPKAKPAAATRRASSSFARYGNAAAAAAVVAAAVMASLYGSTLPPPPTNVSDSAGRVPESSEPPVIRAEGAASAEQASGGDEHPACGEWAASGECERNPAYMGKAQRVPVDWSLPELPPDLATAQRESDEAPPRAAGGARPRCVDERPDCASLARANLSACGEAAFMLQRLLAMARDEEEGDQLAEDGCTRDPTIDAVTKRMTRTAPAWIAGVPEENAEYFQILKYEPGQFYRTHHDQQSAHWTPQGVRVYTFFVYLSDAGGGTRFTDLGITVTPKLGRAVLWPSVLDSDLLTGEREPKTHHEAVTVEAGVKYAANLWIHLYDFKSPSRAGECPFLGQNTHNGR
ncbi:prolyl 4-hydroxylase alpha subunit [Emiliania huxleyi CCMP1516]|uniref:Fe2OG dioxygenase domain-containing protein n=2 Tax=Emiliania huxleyi TaxID=2903 RepID=A0A0D3IFY7_EMIH1|nr:prolyl 4-hydroxylase alpha subunit [Emiliania huxleyi CCMP1516]EOD10172.1 prolyl 4-hydroxylase alpha subunit [Emiliania huxleyi CCMP1516]|eukprot:XP_005762601.1 prolyl 4-hydroxylase alpha subunit [Emiliania huxleyi CCMP1516]